MGLGKESLGESDGTTEFPVGFTVELVGSEENVGRRVAIRI